MFKRRHKVIIHYKSGISVKFRASEFSINNDTYSWKDAYPRPLKLGAEDIESVWYK